MLQHNKNKEKTIPYYSKLYKNNENHFSLQHTVQNHTEAISVLRHTTATYRNSVTFPPFFPKIILKKSAITSRIVFLYFMRKTTQNTLV